MQVQAQTFIFFGIAGSGKGTQVKLLMDFLKSKDNLETVYAGTGEGFRQFINSDNFTSNVVKEKLARGEYIDDFLTNTIFTNILIESLTPKKNLIADGYPRTINQSETLRAALSFFNRDKIKIIYIEVSKEESTKRNLLRGRSDDTEEGLAKRYDEYVSKVIPAMNYFKDKEDYEIFTINGEQSIEDVHKDIISAIGGKANQS